MANFRESIDTLKEAGLTDWEILEIMSESVDGQMFTKNWSFIIASGHELPTKNNDATVETPSVRKKKASTLSTKKLSKIIRQGSPISLTEYPFHLSPLAQKDLVFQQIGTKRLV